MFLLEGEVPGRHHDPGGHVVVPKSAATSATSEQSTAEYRGKRGSAGTDTGADAGDCAEPLQMAWCNLLGGNNTTRA